MLLSSIQPSLTPNDQATSRLLQIPAEIRLIILRQLLKCRNPIYSLHSTDDVEYLESIQRSAQVLRTCQLLYKEGLAILYTENILCIDFMDLDPENEEETVHFCGILEMYLPVPEKLIGAEEELLSLINYATPDRATSSDDTGLMRQSAETLIRHWGTLQKFSRVQVRIQYATQPTVLSASRMLQGLLNGKAVTFTLSMVEEAEEYRVPEAEFEKSAAQMLQSCALLRCKSIVFEKQNFTLPEIPQPSIVENVHYLTAAITGTIATQDTYFEWVRTRKRLCRFFDKTGDFEEDYEEQLKAVQQAAMDYNQASYNDKLLVVMTKVKENLTQDFEDRIALCESNNDAAELQEELDTTIASIEARFGSELAVQI